MPRKPLTARVIPITGGFKLIVGGKSCGKFSSVAAAKGYLHGKYGSRFKPKNSSTSKRRKNISQGFIDGSGFHPIRSAADYDPSLETRKTTKRKTLKGRTVKKAVKKAKKRTAKRKALVRKGSKRSAMTRYRSSQNPKTNASGLTLTEFLYAAGISDPSNYKKYGVSRAVLERAWKNDEDPSDWKVAFSKKRNSTSTKTKRKRAIPAAFRAAAARAKAMTPAQRAAWAKKMQAARKAAAAKRRSR